MSFPLIVFNAGKSSQKYPILSRLPLSGILQINIIWLSFLGSWTIEGFIQPLSILLALRTKFFCLSAIAKKWFTLYSSSNVDKVIAAYMQSNSAANLHDKHTILLTNLAWDCSLHVVESLWLFHFSFFIIFRHVISDCCTARAHYKQYTYNSVDANIFQL